MGAVRNIAALKEMERVAERLAAKRADSGPTDVAAIDFDDDESGPMKRVVTKTTMVPAPAESGVRASTHDAESDLELARQMSFTVYKLEDLDARARTSTPPSAPPPPPSRWPSVYASAKALVVAFMAWRTELARPKLLDAMSVPATTLRVDLFEALKTLPWKKIGLYGGSTVGGFLALLVAVLAIADFTDDLKPAHELHVTNAIVSAPLAPVEPVAEAPAPAPEPAAVTPAIEIDDAPAAPAPVAKKTKHGKKKKKAAQPDIFNP